MHTEISNKIIRSKYVKIMKRYFLYCGAYKMTEYTYVHMRMMFPENMPDENHSSMCGE